MEMTKQIMFRILLLVALVAATGMDTVVAAPCDVLLEQNELSEDTDVFEDVLAAVLQWFDKMFDSEAAGHTSAVSIWNH